MKLPFHGQSVKLVWKYGEEAICPCCQHRNACLQTMSRGHVNIYECRDCHTLFMTHSEDPVRIIGVDGVLQRRIGEQDAKVIGRSLGKDCSECKSFDLQELGYDARQRWQDYCVASLKGDKFQAARMCPTHRCMNCGAEHRY